MDGASVSLIGVNAATLGGVGQAGGLNNRARRSDFAEYLEGAEAPKVTDSQEAAITLAANGHYVQEQPDPMAQAGTYRANWGALETKPKTLGTVLDVRI